MERLVPLVPIEYLQASSLKSIHHAALALKYIFLSLWYLPLLAFIYSL